MLPLIACLVATQVHIDQPPRLRTVLDNGAAIIVERILGAKTLAVQFFASSRGTEETPTTHGLRHRLEHLIAKGPKDDLDETLETAGAFLRAETQRDLMRFQMTLPSGRLDLGLRTVEQVMQMPVVTQDQIKREAQIIEQEAALREDSAKLSSRAWSNAFDQLGLDVMGNPDVIKNATPEMLAKIHRIQFSGPNLAIAVVGDVDLDAATKACADVLGKAPNTAYPKADRRSPSLNSGGGELSMGGNGQGYMVWSQVPGWRAPQTAARVAAAFALASEQPHCYVVYTPSANPGLVMVGESGAKASLPTTVSKARAANLFAFGRILARAWIRNLLETPEGIAEIRGSLLVQEVDLKPETMLENLDTMTPDQFARAIDSFSVRGNIDSRSRW